MLAPQWCVPWLSWAYQNLGNSVESVLGVIGEDKMKWIMHAGLVLMIKAWRFQLWKIQRPFSCWCINQNPQYYDWMMKGDFPPYQTKADRDIQPHTAQKIINGSFVKFTGSRWLFLRLKCSIAEIGETRNHTYIQRKGEHPQYHLRPLPAWTGLSHSHHWWWVHPMARQIL